MESDSADVMCVVMLYFAAMSVVLVIDEMECFLEGDYVLLTAVHRLSQLFSVFEAVLQFAFECLL